MTLKRGRFGQFLACTGYPECKTTKRLVGIRFGPSCRFRICRMEEKCPQCGKAPGDQAGPLRRVHGLQRLPGVQVHQKENLGNGLSEAKLQGRTGRKEVAPGKDFLWL